MKLCKVKSNWKLIHSSDGKISWNDEVSYLCSYLFAKKYESFCEELIYLNLNVSFYFDRDVLKYYLNDRICCKNNKQIFKKHLCQSLGTLKFIDGKKIHEVNFTLEELLVYCQSFIKKYNVINNI